MGKTLLIGIAAAMLSGCGLLTSKVAEEVAPLVEDYCESESFAQRRVYRDTINAELAESGHSVEITCAGDPVD